MSALHRLIAVVASVAILAGTGCTLPNPPVTTFWQKMGVPQGVIGLRDGLVNRRGNFPGLERKPPLKPIAALENLESPYEMIKVAAEVKQAEDMKKQKIKALKYLGKMGCGCYNKEGAIEAALLEALADCTPEVRIAAAEAIQEASGSCACHDGCGSTCCTEKIQEKLAELAYGEKEGCYIEPNAEVRAAALAALSACPPIVDTEVIEGETLPEALPESAVPPEAIESTSMPNEAELNAALSVISDQSYYSEAQQVSAEITSSDESLVPSLHIQPEFANAEANDDGTIPAMVEMLDGSKGVVQVAFFDSYEIPVGTTIVLMSGGQEWELKVTSSAIGRVESTFDGNALKLNSLAAGEAIKVGILAE